MSHSYVIADPSRAVVMQFFEIARWYRSLVGDDRELVLADESSGGRHAGSTLETSPDEVRATSAI